MICAHYELITFQLHLINDANFGDVRAVTHRTHITFIFIFLLLSF